MNSGTSPKNENLLTKLSTMADGIFSKVVGIIFLLGGLGLFIGIFYTGANEAYQQLTWPSATAIIDSIESNDSGSELLLFLTVNENDGGVRTATMNYSVSQSVETDDYIAPYYIYEGSTITILYQKSDPGHFVIAQPVWGFFVGLLLPLIFIIVGYLQVNTKALNRFNNWNKDWRLWWSVFILAGLACFIMAYFVDEPSPESIIQSTWVARLLFIGIGLPIFSMGTYKMVTIFKGKGVVKNLLTSGVKIEFIDFTLEENKLSAHQNSTAGSNESIYIIKCVYREPNQQLPFVYTSEPINFDPSPHLPSKIAVYINPADKYEYYMDLSFLPGVQR